MKMNPNHHNNVPQKPLNSEAAQCAAARQAFLQAMADSNAAITVRMEDGLMTLTGSYIKADNAAELQADIIGNPQQAETLGRQLAEHLLRF